MAVILCLMYLTATTAAFVSGDDNKTTKTGVVIAQDDHESEWLLWAGKDDEIEVSVTVTSPSNGRVDVYIISSSQYSYYPTGSFTSARSSEDRSSHSFTFTVPDDQTYYLVIDNEDNSRTTDAVPTGSVTVDYEYDNPLAKDIEEAFWTATWFCVAAVVIIVIIIIVIIIVVLHVTKKPKPPQYPPQPPYQQPYQQPPYQQYPQQPQQPYQPPPQQPPGQPPPGQPPPGQ